MESSHLKKIRLYGPIQFFKFLVREFHYKFWTQHVKNSYSQLGEDIVVDNLLGFKKQGFYVDIGANDPVRFNNTFRFYKRGWCGINIEPDPVCFDLLSKKRSRDVNLNIGVGNEKMKAYFFRFEPHTLSTFSAISAKKYIKSGFKLVEKRKIHIYRLADILSLHAANKKIDFISIDTEGLDLDVLLTNNWKLFRPKVLCIEVNERTMIKRSLIKNNEEIVSFLKKVGYKEYFRNEINGIFIDVK